MLSLHPLDEVVIAQHLEAVIGTDLYPILVDEYLVKGIVFGLTLQHHGRITEPGHHLRGLSSCVGLLDATG